MSLIAFGAVVLAALATFIDAPVASYAAAMPGFVFHTLAAITDIGLTKWYWQPALVLFLVLGLLDFQRLQPHRRFLLERIYLQAGFVLAAIALAHMPVNALKYLVGRTRPTLLAEVGAFAFKPLTGGDLHASFPSGHSATCGVIAMVLALWFPRWSVPILLAGGVLAVSRIAAEAHFASDVVAGFSIGALSALALARWLAARGVSFAASADRIAPRVT
ncbi:MAG: phosphatase PAP2 family protein [Mesorhizobium sp.]